MFLMSLASLGWGFKEVLSVDWLLQLSIKQRMRGDWLEWADLQVSYALREAGLGEGDQSPSVYISNHLKLVTDTNEKAKANEFNVLGFKPREHTLNRLQEVQLKARHVRHINIAAVLRRVLDDIYLVRFLGRFAFLNSSVGGYFFVSSGQTANKEERRRTEGSEKGKNKCAFLI